MFTVDHIVGALTSSNEMHLLGAKDETSVKDNKAMCHQLECHATAIYLNVLKYRDMLSLTAP